MIIGIIGGGQLGMMMAQSAINYGHQVISFDPSDDCPIIKHSSKHFCAQFDNRKALRDMCELCDVITYEFENIPFFVVKELCMDYTVFPNYKALKYCQNRILEKRLANELNIDTANYVVIENEAHLKNSLFNKSVLKTCCDGYDGKGQAVITDDITKASKLLVNQCILEEYVDYDFEISIIINRDVYGNITSFPIPHNIHRNNILFKSVVPANISENIENLAFDNARKLARALDIVGTLAVEFFVTQDKLLFNEMAPRPHNSGHYTIEGCDVSQFDQHIKAITSSKILQPTLKCECVMYNILGQDMHIINQFSSENIHLYGKAESRTNRKMGHITFLKNINIDDYFGGYDD